MNVSKKMVWFLVAALAVTGILEAGGGSAGGTGHGKRELVLAHHNAQATMYGRGLDLLAKTFNDSCDTAYITVFHNSELGTINQLLEAVSAGTIDLNSNGFGQASTLHRPLEVFSMPYLVKSIDDWRKLIDIKNNTVLQEVVSGFEKAANVHVVNFLVQPLARHLTCNFPVYSPSDLSGIKVRCIPSDIYTIAITGLGGVPVPIDWAETPTALATGVIEGQENPYSVISDNKFWDVQKYIMETAHLCEAGMIIANQKTWDSLNARERSLLEEAVAVQAAWEWQYNIDQLNQYKQNCINGGMQIITASNGLQVDAFKNNTERLLLQRYPQYSDYIRRINQFLGY